MKGRSRINFVTFDEVLSLLRDLDPDDGPVQTDCRYYRTLRELAFCTLTGHVMKCSTPEKIEAFSRDKLNLLRSYLPFQQGRIESATLQAALEILDWPTWQALLSVVLAQLLKTPLEELPESTGLAVRDEAQALEDLWFRELRNGIWLGGTLAREQNATTRPAPEDLLTCIAAVGAGTIIVDVSDFSGDSLNIFLGDGRNTIFLFSDENAPEYRELASRIKEIRSASEPRAGTPLFDAYDGTFTLSTDPQLPSCSMILSMDPPRRYKRKCERIYGLSWLSCQPSILADQVDVHVYTSPGMDHLLTVLYHADNEKFRTRPVFEANCAAFAKEADLLSKKAGFRGPKLNKRALDNLLNHLLPCLKDRAARTGGNLRLPRMDFSQGEDLISF